jgi:hypothetical protein
VFLDKLECIPNLISSERKYFKSNLDLVQKRSKLYNDYMFDVVNQLVLNECYLKHRDVYKYIALLDIDEAIVPKKANEFFSLDEANKYIFQLNEPDIAIEQIRCKRYEHVANKNESEIESYINTLMTKQNITKSMNLFFSQGIYLDNLLMKMFFSSLELQLPTNLNSSFFIFPLLVKVTDTLRYGDTKVLESFSFEFVISNKKELRYAKSLLKIYKLFIEPFIVRNNGHILKHFQGTERMFMIQDLSSSPRGKSLHTYNPQLELSHTYLSNYAIEFDKAYVEDKSGYFKPVQFTHGHLAHFRRMNNFQFRHVPIKNLNLDVNYLNCYFRPMIDKLGNP